MTTSSRQLVLATGNPGKVSELSDLLAPLGWSVTPQTELGVSDAEETGLTFIENAIIKARHACMTTGLPALADDSGLAVHALGGAPGIYSARYAGSNATDQDNLNKLLGALKDVPESQRHAEFHCVLVLMQSADDPTPLVCHGRWPGRIAFEPSGSGGFGYDPIFIPNEKSCTAAELGKDEKKQLSHRGRALRLLLEALDH
ncbi:RdgB/HAM1 family non-canonical purine NTP pyrophosphatase [Aliidiomarina halalkaliphila]|uniref:dITP/XTP pyrophosphatase n=1 Tax=Aliidiomarina halalkaliphila TaxID=2593535 RepID=A0A552WYQ3_9GAMM|nr:RdgB/HAM1 family non-canonical purine NTP pyrophosphatase [Aliidiomarina halalkaliphila]TRW47950.1 RdgB/HAM1 family non-canonical purine NTP pyrophosphatase [Aliidiomarina halalkaliphila]